MAAQKHGHPTKTNPVHYSVGHFENLEKIFLYLIFKLDRIMAIAAYTPITKESAALILSVSQRTIDNWIANCTMPQPVQIGLGRRVYWHPDEFYGWLNQYLKRTYQDPAAPSPERTRGRPRNTLH
jgi:predicted DNA-binding transcriptional regulator AlpA